MRNLGIPGMALGMVEAGQIAHVQGFGVADASGRAVTPQTPFIIGSVSKSFTALAVMQLVEQGKIELDAPVQTYLPWFMLADKEAAARITVRHLLNQTTGISTNSGMRSWASQEGLEATVRGLGNLPLSQPVGAKFQYSNINYSIAGLIVEKVSGQPYADYIVQHIFVPLEMRHSYASRTLAQADGLSDGHAHRFGGTFHDEGAIPAAYLPSGFLMSSAEDMTHYALAHLNAGRYSDITVLSALGMAELHAPAIPTVGATQYAMGWNVVPYDGIQLVFHNGDTSRFHAIITLMPERGSAVALLANVSGFDYMNSNVVESIARGVINLLNGKPAAPVSVPPLMSFLYWAILATPLLQGLGIVFVWRQRQRMPVWGVILTVVLNVAVAIFLFVYSQDAMPLPALMAFFPELGYTSLVVVMLGIGWSIIYTAMNLKRWKAK
jgi:CubicO group peptidase (beta-lactamase class C family)